jgi:hypothetical protein
MPSIKEILKLTKPLSGHVRIVLFSGFFTFQTMIFMAPFIKVKIDQEIADANGEIGIG